MLYGGVKVPNCRQLRLNNFMLALISVSRKQQLRGVAYVCKADVVLYRMLQHIPDSCRKSRNNHLIIFLLG